MWQRMCSLESPEFKDALVRGTPVFHMSESFRDDPRSCEGDQKFSHPAGPYSPI